MNIDIMETERGNNAFRNEEGSAVLFVKLEGTNKYLQTAFTPMNYPSWEVSTITIDSEDLTNHIARRLDGWYVDKCQLDINIDSCGCVVGFDAIVDNITDHVINSAHAGSYDPTLTERVLDKAIVDSATTLEYNLTKAMHEECYNFILEGFEK